MSARQFASHPEVVSARQLEVTNRAKRAPPPPVRPIRNGTVPLLSSLRPAVSADVWYLTLSDASGMRVREAWDLGFSGRGTRVTVVDDGIARGPDPFSALCDLTSLASLFSGIEHDHPDLEGNFDPECSTDIVDNDRDPWPVPSLNDNNTHGTRCAGEVCRRSSRWLCSLSVFYPWLSFFSPRSLPDILPIAPWGSPSMPISAASASSTINVSHSTVLRSLAPSDLGRFFVLVHTDAKEARALSFNRVGIWSLNASKMK